MKLPPNNTKIVATIGPVSNTPEVLEQMIRAGMNVARLNFSHGDFAEHQQTIEHIRSAAKAVDKRIAIIADLSGLKIRVGKFGVETIQLQARIRFTLTTNQVTGDQWRVPVSLARLPDIVKRGDILSRMKPRATIEWRS